uniref:Cytochrome c oxidase assembly protein n=1 Tax=Anoplophora glabripennis TaxID=217634 RepID=V5FWA7_ANOGL
MAYFEIRIRRISKGKINANIKATEFYKDALKTLRSHKAAVHLLGEPIKDAMIDIGNEKKNYAKENVAKYEVPVKGPKQRGTLYFWAERKNPESNWNVYRIELEVANDSTKRLLLKSTSPD